MSLDSTEIWRTVPPEEKIELLSKAHSKGIFVCLSTIIVFSTLAVCFQASALMWGSLILSPIIFQFAAGKAFKDLKPRLMLEYLAARSAARRYAFSARAKDLGLAVLLRGRMERLYDEDHSQEALEAVVEHTKEAAVWVALFNDAIVMMSERPGGARVEFAHALGNSISLEANSGSEDEYSNLRELLLTCRDKGKPVQRFKITSKYSAALIVFEKKLLQLQENARKSESTPRPVGELEAP